MNGFVLIAQEVNKGWHSFWTGKAWAWSRPKVYKTLAGAERAMKRLEVNLWSGIKLKIVPAPV